MIIRAPQQGHKWVRFRRISLAALRRGEGPLTEPTAGAQPLAWERVLMPLTDHEAATKIGRVGGSGYSHRIFWRELILAN